MQGPVPQSAVVRFRWWLGPAQESVANSVRSERKQRYRLPFCAAGAPSCHLERIVRRSEGPRERWRTWYWRESGGRSASRTWSARSTSRDAAERDRPGPHRPRVPLLGPRGVGKTTIARLLAKALNCAERTDRRALRRVRELPRDRRRQRPRRARDRRRLQHRRRRHPRPERDGPLPAGASRFKIYIIDEVHMLSTAAFNALLKTLEEPPAHVKFIFATTEAQKLPPTVVSRCQRYDFKRIAMPGAVGAPRARSSPTRRSTRREAALFDLAREADGSMRDAQSLLDQVIVVRRQDDRRGRGAGGARRRRSGGPPSRHRRHPRRATRRAVCKRSTSCIATATRSASSVATWCDSFVT